MNHVTLTGNPPLDCFSSWQWFAPMDEVDASELQPPATTDLEDAVAVSNYRRRTLEDEQASLPHVDGSVGERARQTAEIQWRVSGHGGIACGRKIGLGCRLRMLVLLRGCVSHMLHEPRRKTIHPCVLSLGRTRASARSSTQPHALVNAVSLN